MKFLLKNYYRDICIVQDIYDFEDKKLFMVNVISGIFKKNQLFGIKKDGLILGRIINIFKAADENIKEIKVNENGGLEIEIIKIEKIKESFKKGNHWYKKIIDNYFSEKPNNFKIERGDILIGTDNKVDTDFPKGLLKDKDGFRILPMIDWEKIDINKDIRKQIEEYGK